MNKYSYALKILNTPMDKTKLKEKLIKVVISETTGEVTKEDLHIIGFLVNNHKSYLRTLEFSAISANLSNSSQLQCEFFQTTTQGLKFYLFKASHCCSSKKLSMLRRMTNLIKTE